MTRTYQAEVSSPTDMSFPHRAVETLLLEICDIIGLCVLYDRECGALVLNNS